MRVARPFAAMLLIGIIAVVGWQLFDLRGEIDSLRSAEKQLEEEINALRSAQEELATRVGPESADYVFYVHEGTCYALNGVTGEVDYQGKDHAAVIQQALDAIERGVYVFRRGDYLISKPLAPDDFQTWRFASGAEFKPTGDNSIIEIEDVEQLSFEGVLRCIDPATDVDGFLSEDGGVFTDETAAATSGTENDMTFLPAAPLQEGDACYFGKSEKFNCVKLEIGTKAEGSYSVVWEYWDSVAGDWQEITDFRDDSRGDPTNAFSKTGTCYLFFKDVPPNWGNKCLEGKDLYWIRCRVTDVTTYTTPPKGTQAWVFKTMTKPAIRVHCLEFSHWQSVFIRYFFNGIEMEGDEPGGSSTRENTFDDIYMHVRNEGLSLEYQCHDNHFTQLFCKGPSPGKFGHATGNGLRIETDGTQGGNTFPNVEVIDMGKGVNLPGACEVWFGTVLADNAREEAVLVLAASERVFFNSVWASSSDDGLVLCGEPDNPLDATVTIGQVFAWLNSSHGVYLKHDVERVQFGAISVSRNKVGLEIEGANVSAIDIDSLMSWDNLSMGVSCSESAVGIEDVYCCNAQISDECDVTGFTQISGNMPCS